MKEEEIKKLIKKHKYVFIGEIHGTKEIPIKVFELLKDAINGKKVFFCLEIPKEANTKLYNYLEGSIRRNKLFSSVYLKDALNDSRINSYLLHMYRKLYTMGGTFMGLENYNNENTSNKDEWMAYELLDIIKRNKNNVHKYIIYLGNFHTLDKKIRIKKFLLTPIKTYLSKNILSQALTINFSRSSRKKIIFDSKTNTINYFMQLKKTNQFKPQPI